MFIVDSDHLTFLQKDGSPEHRFLVERMRLHPLDKFFVTIVSFHEQVNGWNAYIHRAREANGVVRGYAMFESILINFARMNVLPFDAPTANAFQRFRESGVRVATMDLRIGAIAYVKEFTVLTRNVVDFERIPGVHVEDWTKPIFRP